VPTNLGTRLLKIEIWLLSAKMQRMIAALNTLQITSSPRAAPVQNDDAPVQNDDAGAQAADGAASKATKNAKQERRPLKVVNGVVVPSLASGPPSLQDHSGMDADFEQEESPTEVAPARILFASKGGSRVSCVYEDDEDAEDEDIGREVWNGTDRGNEMQAEIMESLRNTILPGSVIRSEPGYKGTPAKLNGANACDTLIVFDQVFEQYQTYKGCQECSQRVTSLMGAQGIIRTGESDGLSFEDQAEEASLADILRVHDWEYVSELQRRCANMSLDQIKCLDPPGHPQDTSLSRSSYHTAAMAAGAVCKAVDRVMQGECKNAFVAARPPGHHAGPSGLVHTQDGRPSLSQGFCLLNSVAIGAAYAKYNYRQRLSRVAIVDFDVHNGDGTASIVRALRPHVQERRLGPMSRISSPCFKPWVDSDDADKVFFASLHLAADNFYPRMACQDYYPGNTEQAFELGWPLRWHKTSAHTLEG
jgi:acetoin utilization deacetylase AcuC-like enzyme